MTVYKSGLVVACAAYDALKLSILHYIILHYLSVKKSALYCPSCRLQYQSEKWAAKV